MTNTYYDDVTLNKEKLLKEIDKLKDVLIDFKNDESNEDAVTRACIDLLILLNLSHINQYYKQRSLLDVAEYGSLVASCLAELPSKRAYLNYTSLELYNRVLALVVMCQDMSGLVDFDADLYFYYLNHIKKIMNKINKMLISINKHCKFEKIRTM